MAAVPKSSIKAADIVARVSEGSFSNLLLDALRYSGELSDDEMRQVTATVCGTVEKKIAIDHILSGYLKKGSTEKLDRDVRAILETGAYRILYMDSMPDHAVVNMCVDMCSRYRKTSAKGLVNAVLRKIAQSRNEIKTSIETNPSPAMRYSVDESICEAISADYGERTDDILASFSGIKPVHIRINTLKTDEGSFLEELDSRKIQYERTDIPGCIRLKGGSLRPMASFEKGSFRVQSYAAQCAVDALCPEPGIDMLDSCSAPGGKTVSSAMRMKNTGTITAVDKYPGRTKLVENACREAGIDIVRTVVANMTKGLDSDTMYDRILCDVPCSGLGEISGKPEIRLHRIEEYKGLPAIQYEILEKSAAHLKAGGILVYSTCTILKRENEEIIERFLSRHEEFTEREVKEYEGSEKAARGRIFLPSNLNSEGFYIASLLRL
ncbi:MAG: 16S rRNA (cytosine(967)-C(5))-methyltransferase RsmB [Oscillospiraceae bacterium]|nr:16S rRNA (cytosine(967)-C(5))-methyltransferase RsmB [Oscillospiraceae bacterium]